MRQNPKGKMLTEEEKTYHFKRLQSRNYKASLLLEGIHLDPTEKPQKHGMQTEAKLIAELKARYAR
ncbi:YhfG family protein [Photobacterium nomapromontoriensis]|uniref:YhfG family protein n=1 Tax=Photobacterium nomapromontoriensis TaxID=2910237 RepID=UPI003D0C4FC7